MAEPHSSKSDPEVSMTPPKFTNFLISMSKDPKALAAFAQDPTGTMTHAGLSHAEQTLLLSKDARLIQQAVMAELDHEPSADPKSPRPMPPVIVLIAIV
jgi:hypothetical protein